MSSHGSGEGEAAQAASRLPFPVDVLVRLAGAISTLLILATLVITVVNVIARYGMANSFRGAEELTGYIVVAIVMTGAAEAYRRGDHIAIDFIRTSRFPFLAAASNILFDLSVLVFAVLLGWSGWETVTFSKSFESYSAGYLETPMWIPQTALVVGAVILGLASFTRLVMRLAGRAA